LAAVSGGWYLLGDDATNIDPSARDIFFKPLEADAVVSARPTLDLQDTPPSIWMSDSTLAIFNWSPAPTTWRVSAAVAAAFETMHNVFDPEVSYSMDLDTPLEIPADDVLFLIRSQ